MKDLGSGRSKLERELKQDWDDDELSAAEEDDCNWLADVLHVDRAVRRAADPRKDRWASIMVTEVDDNIYYK